MQWSQLKAEPGLMDQQLNQVCQISASGNSVSHGNFPVFLANVCFLA